MLIIVFFLLWMYLKTFANNSFLKRANEEEQKLTGAIHGSTVVSQVALIGCITHLMTLRYNNLWLVCFFIVYSIAMVGLEVRNAFYALNMYVYLPAVAFVVDLPFLSAVAVCQQMVIDCMYAVIKLRMKDAIEARKRNSAGMVMNM